jgi:DNA-binding MarR family transcriptional regulator
MSDTWAGPAPCGEYFAALRRQVVVFDRRLCAGFTERELATIRKLLVRLRANIADHDTL